MKIKWTPDEPGTYYGSVKHQEIVCYFTHKSWGVYRAGVVYKGNGKPNEGLGQFKTRSAAKSACQYHLDNYSQQPLKIEESIMTDYQVGEKVFAVGRNKNDVAVVVEVEIRKFYSSRKPNGNDCVTQSATQARECDSRKLFKCSEDAIEHCTTLNSKK